MDRFANTKISCNNIMYTLNMKYQVNKYSMIPSLTTTRCRLLWTMIEWNPHIAKLTAPFWCFSWNCGRFILYNLYIWKIIQLVYIKTEKRCRMYDMVGSVLLLFMIIHIASWFQRSKDGIQKSFFSVFNILQNYYYISNLYVFIVLENLSILKGITYNIL